MDTILVISYSYTGTSRWLARLLCSQHGWPMGEVVEERPRSGDTGTLRCVLDSLLRRKPAVRYEGPDPDDFHTVVLVAPIWVSRLAGPMRSFIASHREALRHVAVVLTTGGGSGAGAVAEVTRMLGRAPILATEFHNNEIGDGGGMARLTALGDQLVPPSATTPTLPPQLAAAHA